MEWQLSVPFSLYIQRIELGLQCKEGRNTMQHLHINRRSYSCVEIEYNNGQGIDPNKELPRLLFNLAVVFVQNIAS